MNHECGSCNAWGHNVLITENSITLSRCNLTAITERPLNQSFIFKHIIVVSTKGLGQAKLRREPSPKSILTDEQRIGA